MNVAVVGAGAYGSSLGHILKQRGYLVRYFDPAKYAAPLEEIIKDADYIVISVPSVVLPDILPALPKGAPLIVATKGILGMSIFEDFRDVMVLSGPGFANDFDNDDKICLTITDERVRELFGEDKFKYDFTLDKSGVLYCGALKNIYAISAGYRELARGSDAWEDFIHNALLEMEQVLVANGCSGETIKLHCGEDDLRLTAGLPSRNYEYGMQLKQFILKSGGPGCDLVPAKTVEGLSALTKIRSGEAVVPREAKFLRELIGIIWD